MTLMTLFLVGVVGLCIILSHGITVEDWHVKEGDSRHRGGRHYNRCFLAFLLDEVILLACFWEGDLGRTLHWVGLGFMCRS